MNILTKFLKGLVSSKTQDDDESFNELYIRVNLEARSEEEKAKTILQVIEVLEKEIIIKNKQHGI